MIASQSIELVVGHDHFFRISEVQRFPERPGDDLAGSSTKRHPEPELASLGAHKAPEFIEFKHIAVLARQEGVHESGELLGFFPPPTG